MPDSNPDSSGATPPAGATPAPPTTGSGAASGTGNGHAPPATGDDGLGDAGREAIRRERDAARLERERAETLQRELDALKDASASEQEKATKQAVTDAVNAERQKIANAVRAMRSEFALVAAGMSPSMAKDFATSARFAGLKVNVDDLTVDGVEGVIEDMKKADPAYFAAATRKPGDVARGPQHPPSAGDQAKPGRDRIAAAYAASSKS